MTYNGGEFVSYCGEWLSSERNGQGILEYRNGDIYEGCFLKVTTYLTFGAIVFDFVLIVIFARLGTTSW